MPRCLFEPLNACGPEVIWATLNFYLAFSKSEPRIRERLRMAAAKNISTSSLTPTASMGIACAEW